MKESGRSQPFQLSTSRNPATQQLCSVSAAFNINPSDGVQCGSLRFLRRARRDVRRIGSIPSCNKLINDCNSLKRQALPGMLYAAHG
ncbi:hypothetical protein NECAME_04090 [Necator americanus]|uniref:Uncharacterized protein n=1 Tax=Necator americanus TaxID=51031 RepID=W2SX57_NECAM|nr:hypothetical protein NECAME_04090 [Necator americanus]ETN74225.1 hypothetical protein NECAME_04090 [Necator americanus]